MVKTIIAYMLGFSTGLFFILSVIQGHTIIGLIITVMTFIISLIIANKIHKRMKSQYENRKKGIGFNYGNEM